VSDITYIATALLVLHYIMPHIT